MTLALCLARYGVRSVILEADAAVCDGSRAICLSRRTLEILDRLGILRAFLEKGLPWTSGRSFHEDTLVYRFSMPHDDDQRLPPMVNLQQYYIESFLADEIAHHPDLIDMRWGTEVTAFTDEGDRLALTARTDGAEYELTSDFVAACDGARSRIRNALGLKMSGVSYEGRYVIADIRIAIDLPTERMAWFDPPSNPGRTVLMHRQPDDLWRIDYQMLGGETTEEMLRGRCFTGRDRSTSRDDADRRSVGTHLEQHVPRVRNFTRWLHARSRVVRRRCGTLSADFWRPWA